MFDIPFGKKTKPGNESRCDAIGARAKDVGVQTVTHHEHARAIRVSETLEYHVVNVGKWLSIELWFYIRQIGQPVRYVAWLDGEPGFAWCDNVRVGNKHGFASAAERGFQQFLATLDDGRIAIAALAVGVLQACLDESVGYATVRESFGKPIGSYQAVAFKVADIKVMTEAARLLTYRAAWLKDTGQSYKEAAAIAKLYATEAAITATRAATQVFGGAGYIDDTLVARHYRDAKILEIGEGTSEIQRLVISRALGLPVD